MNKFISNLFLIIITIFAFTVSEYAQDYLFTVIASSGKVNVNNPNSNEWKLLKTGDKLFGGDKVKLSSGNYLGLAHINGKAVELKSEGVFEVNVLSNKIGKENNSLTKNFTKYVLNEMVVSNNKSKNMKMLGAVVRAAMNTIELDAPFNTNLILPILNASWYHSGITKNYVFRLINPSGKTIFMKSLTDTSISFNLKEFNLQRDSRYKWFIFSGENNTIASDSAGFYLLSENKIKAINDTLGNLKSGFDDEGSLLNQLIIASLYERNNLYFEANEVFENIIRAAPKIDLFKDRYIRFLTETGMLKKAQMLFSQSSTN